MLFYLLFHGPSISWDFTRESNSPALGSEQRSPPETAAQNASKRPKSSGVQTSSSSLTSEKPPQFTHTFSGGADKEFLDPCASGLLFYLNIWRCLYHPFPYHLFFAISWQSAPEPPKNIWFPLGSRKSPTTSQETGRIESLHKQNHPQPRKALAYLEPFKEELEHISRIQWSAQRVPNQQNH